MDRSDQIKSIQLACVIWIFDQSTEVGMFSLLFHHNPELPVEHELFRWVVNSATTQQHNHCLVFNSGS